jgi:hypothetical protein
VIAKDFVLKLLIAAGLMLGSILILFPVDYRNRFQRGCSELALRSAAKNALVIERNNQAKRVQEDV